ncbi:MAG: 4-(cytidine 5'-diphospho)-2-C-methyl-D-erythritol kinase [Bacteroidota bacterium]
MICFPNAKINLGLHVINKRDDGFHNIETVFLPVGFSDVLECVENKNYSRQQKCVFVSHGLAVSGKASDNLVVKAYHMLDAAFNLPPVLVHLNKIIPMGAGLGGGSSDAAYMIKLLNGLFELKLAVGEMENYAAKLGSDCAFFIANKPAYLLGKGHELESFFINLAGYYLVLVNTGAHSNTALAYKHAQRRDLFDRNNNLKHILQKPVLTWKDTLVNDFEASVFKSIPELYKVKKWLYTQGAEYASMSGSGASMFGLFSEKPKLKGTWKEFVVFEEPLKSKNSG